MTRHVMMRSKFLYFIGCCAAVISNSGSAGWSPDNMGMTVFPSQRSIRLFPWLSSATAEEFNSVIEEFDPLRILDLCQSELTKKIEGLFTGVHVETDSFALSYSREQDVFEIAVRRSETLHLEKGGVQILKINGFSKLLFPRKEIVSVQKVYLHKSKPQLVLELQMLNHGGYNGWFTGIVGIDLEKLAKSSAESADQN